MNCSSYNLSYIYLEVFGESATLDCWLNITFLIVFFAGCLMLHGLILLQKCVKRYGSLIVLRICLCSWRLLSLSLSAGFFLEQVADVLCKWECSIKLAKTKQKATKMNKSKAFMAAISILLALFFKSPPSNLDNAGPVRVSPTAMLRPNDWFLAWAIDISRGVSSSRSVRQS